MKLFLAITRRSFSRHLTYRAATAAGLLTNFFFGLFRLAVLLALYGSREEVAGLTVEGLVTYVVLTQGVIAYLSLFGWYDLMNSVHSGEVATDLLKPMSFFNFWLAQDFGRALVALLLRGLTIMALYSLIFDLANPTSGGQWLAVLLAVALSWLISFTWRFFINLAAFWTPNALGIGRFGFIVAWFFSGFLMPIHFYPQWVQRITYLTPFPHMLNTVADVYVGVLSGRELVEALLVQGAWVVLLMIACQLVLRTGIRRLVILGG